MTNGDATSNLNIRRNQLLNEVVRHRTKLEAAERLHQALQNIPATDPFETRQVLRFRRKGYEFAALRTAGGFWYITGNRVGQPQRTKWVQFIDWLVEGGVTEVEVMVGTGVSPLSELDSTYPAALAPDWDRSEPEHVRLPYMPCMQGQIHDAHPFQGGTAVQRHGIPGAWYWCPGQEKSDAAAAGRPEKLRPLACSYTDVEDHAPHEWTHRGEQVWCHGQ
jgi:hypothetical protein